MLIFTHPLPPKVYGLYTRENVDIYGDKILMNHTLNRNRIVKNTLKWGQNFEKTTIIMGANSYHNIVANTVKLLNKGHPFAELV